MNRFAAKKQVAKIKKAPAPLFKKSLQLSLAKGEGNGDDEGAKKALEMAPPIIEENVIAVEQP